MGEFGKRTRQDRDHRDRDHRDHRDRRDRDDDGKNQRRRHGTNDTSDDGELVLYRILCPVNVIGSVIGKAGKVIKSLRQETHATIKVVDPSPGADKRVILIYCHVKDKDTDVDEDGTEPLCAAQAALLKVHAVIVDALNNRETGRKGKQDAYLLAPSSQAANIIGKAGATIKRLRSKTNANIRVNPKDPNDMTHSCANIFDNFIQISGDAEEVERALYVVSAIMYKFPPRENISLDTTVEEQLPPTIIIPSDVPFYPGGGFYPGADAVTAAGSLPPVIGAAPHYAGIHGYPDNANWPGYPPSLPVISGYGGPSKSEELVIKVLCPSDRIGRVIGRGGGIIKSVRQSSGARVDVDDKKVENDQCVITVTSTESSEDAKSAALEAVLLLQEKMAEEDDDTVKFRLLVPTKVIGCLIGRNGSVVNDMRKKTRADIRISKNDKPKKSDGDELVEVYGEVDNLRDALVQIILRLRKNALGEKDDAPNVPEVDSMYTSSLSAPQVLPSIPPSIPCGYDRDADRGLGMIGGSSLYEYSSSQAGDRGYSSLSSYASKIYGGLPSYIEVLIPANAVGKVMGRGGTNIENIQSISGASINVVESKSSRSERIAQISGTSDQKRTAENLIQAFIMAT